MQKINRKGFTALNRKQSPVKEYKTFANLKRRDLETYALSRLPLPAPTERFNWEDSAAFESKLLAEVQGWNRHMRRKNIALRVLSLFVSIVLFLIAYFIGIWWITISVMVAAAVLQRRWEWFGWRDRIHFKQNLEYVQHFDYFLGDIHLHHLHQWALTRYDFTPEEREFAVWAQGLQERFYLGMGGPLSGFLVSSATDEEWPLKPTAKP